MQLVLLWGPWIDIVPKSTAQLLFVPKSCYVKNFLQWPHPSKSWNKLILMEHAFDVRFTYNKNMNVLWVVDFGRGVSVCKNRGWNLKTRKKKYCLWSKIIVPVSNIHDGPWWHIHDDLLIIFQVGLLSNCLGKFVLSLPSCFGSSCLWSEKKRPAHL